MKSKTTHTLLLIALIFSLSTPSIMTHASSLTVNSLADAISVDGLCTLREAIQNANQNTATHIDCAAGSGADTITFSLSGTITLGSALPTISDTAVLTIDGAGQSVTISGNNLVRMVTVNSLAVLTVHQLTIANGSTIVYGGGIENYGTLTITNSVFTNNHSTDYHGGAIYNQSGLLTITESTFSSNTAHQRGGGIYSLGGVVNITSTAFSNNTAADGGGIYSYDCTLTIADSTFSENNAPNGGGGGIYSIYGPLTISNTSFAANGASWGSGGGGIYNKVGLLTIANSTFSENSASGSPGGGIFNQASMNIRLSTLSGNSAGTGGAVYNAGDNVTIANSTFSANGATASSNNGGGIYNTGKLIVTNSTLSGNTAPGNGGGLGNVGGTLTLRNTVLAHSTGGNCSGVITNGGNNLEDGATCGWGSASGSMSNTDPLLGVLTGSPAFFPLNPGSPAIDRGDDSICTAWPVSNQSQNGLTRPQSLHCDIGSYELDLPIRTYLPLLFRN